MPLWVSACSTKQRKRRLSLELPADYESFLDPMACNTSPAGPLRHCIFSPASTPGDIHGAVRECPQKPHCTHLHFIYGLAPAISCRRQPRTWKTD